MTKKQIEALVRKLLKYYKHEFFLGQWTLYIGFSDEPPSDFVRGCTLARSWEYMQASLEFYPCNMRNDSREEIRRHVRHEMLHLVVAEMREKNLKHEERVVTTLDDIIDSLEREAQ